MAVVEVVVAHIVIMSAFGAFPRRVVGGEARLIVQPGVTAIAVPLGSRAEG